MTIIIKGVSDTPAWVVVKANAYARQHGKTPFAIFQGAWSILERDFERDNYMSAEEAKAYGMIDHVIQQRGELVDVTTVLTAAGESSW